MYKIILIIIISSILIFSTLAQNNEEVTTMALNLQSSAFKNLETIPTKYTCSGDNISPPLSWKNRPEGAKSFALICDDPDAPGQTWVHWVIYNIPAGVTHLPEKIPHTGELDNGTLQGNNDFGDLGYGGPCPPTGPAHRYFFKLYALDIKLNPGSGASSSDILKAMKGHILDETELIGKFSR